jgi:predicted kinase
VKTLTIIRGLPGAGKSTLAERLDESYTDSCWAEADMFFYLNPEMTYQWDALKVPDAHRWCQDVIADALANDMEQVIVSNTFTRRREMVPYLSLAHTFGYQVQMIEVWASGLTDEQLAARCQHHVPVETITRMRARWED